MKTTEAAVETIATAKKGDKTMKSTKQATKAPSPAVVGEGYEPKIVVPSTKHYALGDKAAREMQTLSTAKGKTGLGRGWRAAATGGRNTRAIALDAIEEAMGEEDSLTEDAVLAALTTVKDQLGSGSPRSYLRAFVASGYLTEA